MSDEASRRKTKEMAGLDDRRIGALIMRRRREPRMTQRELEDRVGMSFQQGHKYETGVNRVSASRLVDYAAALGVPVTYFYEQIIEREERSRRSELADDPFVAK